MDRLFFQDAKWVLLAEAVYMLILIGVCIRVVYDTRSVTKTLGYLLLVIFVPVLGMTFYFSFGINYRKRKIYTKKLLIDESIKAELQEKVEAYRKSNILELPAVIENRPLVALLSHSGMPGSGVFPNSEVSVLQNGEQLFPVLLAELEKAEKHIHIEYYIYENDAIGNTIKDVLIRKAAQGVEVRFIYDDFGSLSIRRTLVRELRANGVQAHPFNQIRMIMLANRLNYRNHRKIVVIDGVTSFVGGINVSDKYINGQGKGLYWRDTHLMIRGASSLALQQIFLADWNFCAGGAIAVDRNYFPVPELVQDGGKLVQVTASGPDSDLPNILYAMIQAVSKARKEILITTPYYIPDSSLQEALIIAALSNIEVKLLVPAKGDSFFVSLASQSYFDELLAAGVRVYRYTKGFVHAKTVVVDRKMASVGTANMDLRSFDLNFEVAAFVYDREVAGRLADDFFLDLEDAEEIDFDTWSKRSGWKVLVEKTIRLLSPFM